MSCEPEQTFCFSFFRISFSPEKRASPQLPVCRLKERWRERGGRRGREVVHTLLCLTELSNHLATAAWKSAADWHWTGLTLSAPSALRAACTLQLDHALELSSVSESLD